MNKELFQDIKNLKNGKWIVRILIAVAVLTYGYFVTHSTIGMDDTAIETYFVEGFAPYVGRWTLFLLNYVFDFASYTPYFMDILGVALLCLAAYLFCVLWTRISGGKVRTLSLIAFATIFITYPLIGEVYIFYLHNGISLSFVLMALTGLAWWDYLSKGDRKQFIWMTLFLSLAIGCYESFATVYIVLICGIYTLGLVNGTIKKRKFKIWLKDLVFAVIPLVLAMLIRSTVYTFICVCLGMTTSARDMSALQLWFVNPPLVLLKDLIYQFLMRFVANGEYIFGVKVFVVTTVVFILASFVFMIAKKKWSMLLFGIGIVLAPWLLIFLQLVITPYRATQALMLFIAFGWLICFEYLFLIDWKKGGKVVQVLAGVVLAIVVFRQGFELHQYFYFDAAKDEYNEAYCHELAQELIREYDTTKPVIFIGQREMPEAFSEQVYLTFDSQEYYDFSEQFNFGNTVAFTNFVDSRYGYRIYDIAATDTLDWMSYADLSDGEYEVYRYMEMLGYKFEYPAKDVILEARDAAMKADDYPVWPQKGSIVEDAEYIYVYLGRVLVNF